jgi:uncharacterized membrane protein YdbT with pleckstrin-like domain
MGYADRVLQPGETIQYRAHLHWVLMLPGFLLAGAAAAIAITGLMARNHDLHQGLLIIAGLILLAAAWSLMRAWLRRISTEIAVSNQRIILKTGLLSTSSIEMNLDKVESVIINQTLFGRMLDYGAVVVRGVGAGLEPVRNVADPLGFRRAVGAGS